MKFPKPQYHSSKSLVHTLDRVFSEFIRLRDSDAEGYCTCITCGQRFFWKDGDAGHFIQRDRKATRWDEKNVAAQCKHCNRFRGGEQFIFGKAIDKKYGAGTADSLKTFSQILFKVDNSWLAYHIGFFRARTKELKKLK